MTEARPSADAIVSTPAQAHQTAGSAAMLGALGVVFGDIGTSPIYAFRESIKAAGGAASETVVLGVLSLVFWAVVLIVALKYVVIVMRADNQGEGGTMALLALALPAAGRWQPALLVVGLAGASLFFGDAMITPAISVLSAVEGVEIVTPLLKPYIVPLAAVILLGVFSIQSRGSGSVGRLFGPVMAAWFTVLALAGIVQIWHRPGVLAALDPRYAVAYLAHAGAWPAFAVLGSVFLALTGGEALYADMGHFGRRAIRVDWFSLVMPALVLNYLGQGTLVLSDPDTASNPFFLLVPSWSLIPFVALTTAATVIASQAVISGAFALVQQAIQLGALPRLDIRQTSEESAGQVYVPQVNWMLAAAVLALVFGFRSSDALANAYGIAVAGDMTVTTVLVATVALGVWHWPLALVAPVAALFLLLDLTFVSANVHKIPGGGWFPLLVGAIALVITLTWRKGRTVALARREEGAVSVAKFESMLAGPSAPLRVPGTAVYLTSRQDVVPAALMLNLKHNHVFHDRMVLLKVSPSRSPRIADETRLTISNIAPAITQVEMRFGFAEKPDVPAALTAHAAAIGCDAVGASFFIGREVPMVSLHPEVARWQERIYAFLVRNAVSAPDYFLIPPERVVELGTKVEL